MNFAPIDPTDPRPIRDIVYATLRDALLQGHCEAGERLVETQLAQQLRVSRTPVREALRMLEQDGLAVAVPRRGTVVAKLKIDDAVEIYDLRAVLEGLCARLAAEQITERELKQLRGKLEKMRPHSANHKAYMKAHADFNQIIIAASRSERIALLIDTFAGQLRRLRGVSLASKERQEEAWKEHEAIVEALIARDSVRAEALARQHVEHAKRAFLDQQR